MRVLIADDDPVIQTQLTGILQRMNLEVMVCGNGQEVLAKLFAGDLPQLVLLDINMPHASGQEVCRTIRQKPTMRYVHVMMVTVQNAVEDVLTALRHGANDFITKPVIASEIQARVQIALQMIQLHNRVEEQRQKLMNTARMAMIGHLASGIANELAHPLAIMRTYLEQISRALGPDLHAEPSTGHKALAEIQKSVDRMNGTVRAMRDFAAEDDAAPLVRSSLGDLIPFVLGFCEAKLKSLDMDLRVTLAPTSPQFMVQKTRLVQVLLSLIDHAIGSIAAQSKPWIALEDFEDANWVHIAVTDNGRGIPLAVRPQIYDPFFTLPQATHGRSLGLSVAKGIVESQGGTFKLDESSAQTRFVISLPKKNR